MTLPWSSYDRAAVTGGIVHLGVGGFHRAHQAVYLDRLAEAGGDPAWGICAVGVLPADRRIIDTLAAQDGLYTVVEKHPDGQRPARVVGSIVEWLFGPDDPGAVVERIADPRTRIVSLTITEGGYVPGPAFDHLADALALRRARGQVPFTVMSCDNLPGNGAIARKTLLETAQEKDPDLADWIEAEVAFPSSMVDRITPATTPADVAAVEREHGYPDAWPVICEPFLQWALEDHFTQGRPALDEVGVLLTDDVAPYELMKLRLLNAGHQAIGYIGRLLGHHFAHEAMADPEVRAVLAAYLAEAAPTVPPVPGVDLDDYQVVLAERFANPEVADTLERLCAFTSDRIPAFVLPAVRDNLAASRPVRLGALVIATWARYLRGVDHSGRLLEVVDHIREPLVAAASSEDALALLRVGDLFDGLADDPRFTEPYVEALGLLDSAGTRQGAREWLRRTRR